MIHLFIERPAAIWTARGDFPGAPSGSNLRRALYSRDRGKIRDRTRATETIAAPALSDSLKP